MNESTDIKLLLQKFIKGQCSPAEAEKVLQYCKDNHLTADFPTVEEVKYLLETLPEPTQERSDTLFLNIMARAQQEEQVIENEPKIRKIYWKRYTAVAACFAIMATGGWFFLQNNEEAKKPVLQLDGTEITLQFENGDIQVIKEDGSTQIIDAEGNVVGSQDKTSITYSNDADVEGLVYNTLKIPYGKHFQLQLSDGTVVHLNAGTTLRYPVKFLAGQERTVYLDGEAFFDVSKDKKHPFIVNADELNVRVLGTHFNVSNYPEDARTDVVLVEGSVGLYTAGKTFDAQSTMLEPGYKGSLSKGNTVIKVKEVSTHPYTAWVKNELVFRNMTFKNICRKLERQYNVTITNSNNTLANERFNASFKNEPVEKVLGYFHELNGFAYTIKDNIVTIK
ncbi:iron dicitrate transport regulator FecR [Flavobacterium akiainvivens]|uniref:Iron dicitrate transport regulator FecR n=1 Tax=Flavobacterium akiainvivens TaxID=1202724 RepID=A0A0N0RQL5_9FLAO|nr:FecR family protein [Flavobacterium akiainvivens]KOS05606.1 iron dicitrate transport regulator FecR [Flavobacterium akiainvivens]SFQ35251.1 FecR family protein [Flavobacterium akiainvivens]